MAFDKSFFNNVLGVVVSRLLSDETASASSRQPDSMPVSHNFQGVSKSDNLYSDLGGAERGLKSMLDSPTNISMSINGRNFSLPAERWGHVKSMVVSSIGEWVSDQKSRMEASDYVSLLKAFDEWKRDFEFFIGG